jgi:hypothetical protein
MVRLLRVADVPASERDLLFLHSRARALIAAGALVAVSVVSTVLGWQRHALLLYYIAAVLLGALVVFHGLVTARFRPTNWLVRASDDGLYIKFRSYLNSRFPTDQLTVVFIPYAAIRSARLVRERREVPDHESSRRADSVTIQRGTTVVLEFSGDVTPVTQAIEEETRRVLGRKGPGTRYRHTPVRMSSGNTLELDWTVVPRASALLALLSNHGVPTETAESTTDYAHLETLTRDEQEKRLVGLVGKGDTIAAIRIARRLYGYDLTRAKQFVDGLHGDGHSTGR